MNYCNDDESREKKTQQALNAIQALEFINIYMKIKKKYHCKLPCGIRRKKSFKLTNILDCHATQTKIKAVFLFQMMFLKTKFLLFYVLE